MTTLRFRQRHVHRTIRDYVQSGLTNLGWVDEPVNFGTTPVTFIDVQPEEAGISIAPNTVALTLGDEPADRDEELGAGLRSCAYTVFVDVYGADAPTAISIASDVRDLLRDQIIALADYTTDVNGATTASTIEFETVIIEKPATVVLDNRHWRVVKATATLYYT